MFEFIPKAHKYFLDGKELTAVSELIRPLSAFDFEDDEYLADIIDNAAERGVVCHKALEELLGGKDIGGECPNAYEPYIGAIRMFLTEHTVVPIYIEKPFYSAAMRLAGTPDLICLFDGEAAIIDYKFVVKVDKPRVKAQLNAYRVLCAENGIDVDTMYVVQFLEDGAYRLYPVETDIYEIELLLEIRDRKYKKHKKGRIG